MLNVAIAVDSPTDYGPEAVHVIVAACEEVIGENRCPAASELGPGMVTAWYAVVHPNDFSLGSARIQFRDRSADGILLEERLLTFPRQASQRSRLGSIGSVIAALAAAREGGPIPPHPKLAEPSSVPLQTAGPQPSTPPDWSAELGAFAIPSLGGGPYRLGALGSAHVGFGARPFALFSARYAVHPGNPRLSWWDLSAGVGTRFADRAARFNLELAGELVFEHTSAVGERGAEQDNASQNGWGGRVGAAVVWAGWQHTSIVGGLDVTWILPRVRVVIEGHEVAQVPLTTAAFFVGARFDP